MQNDSGIASPYVEALRNSGITIYDAVDEDDPTLWIPTEELGEVLSDALVGVTVRGLPPRTRSKKIKEQVCVALGYPVPASFRRAGPDFPGQQLDIYVQKSRNLQIWNERVDLDRRYAIVIVGEQDRISRAIVLSGSKLAALDSTGTLTHKIQARWSSGGQSLELFTEQDTERLISLVRPNTTRPVGAEPLDSPAAHQLLTIKCLFDLLSSLIGKALPFSGQDQDRKHGEGLHRLVCECLGYDDFADDGRFPDVRHQLLEVKLQRSPTIDLGLAIPGSQKRIDLPKVSGLSIRYCDVRFAVFGGELRGNEVVITHLVMTTGEGFFDRFPQMQGQSVNKKIQLRLPEEYFVE